MSVKSVNHKFDDDEYEYFITKGNEDRVYTYDEAIELAGSSGWYNIGLMLTLGLSTLGMAIELCGFSVIVNGATCDLGLDLRQSSILLSVCFLGPILTAYFWGYYSDTHGRRRSLLIALWSSYLFSTFCAFVPNWVVLAVMKFISASFCNSVLSLSYTLLGERCASTIRDKYMLLMTSFINWAMIVYIVVAYLILNLDFSYALGYTTFTPWRLLAIILALPLGIGAISMHYFYESPKFLINARRDEEALDILARMWKRNNNNGLYLVQKVVLNEEGNINSKSVSFIKSLWDQIAPIFKPPLLWRSLQLYFSTFVIFSTNSGFTVWFPFIVDIFSAGLSFVSNNEKGLCNIILHYNNVTTSTKECRSKPDIMLIWSSLGEGFLIMFLLLILAKISCRKRLLQIGLLSVSGITAILTALIKDNLTSVIMYMGILINDLSIGILFSFYIELFPTSYRGMASCVGTMVARLSGVVGIYTLGAFLLTRCEEVFYFSGFLLFCTAAVTTLLPSDKKQNSIETNHH